MNTTPAHAASTSAAQVMNRFDALTASLLTAAQLEGMDRSQWSLVEREDFAAAVEKLSRAAGSLQVVAAHEYVQAAHAAREAGIGTRLRTKTPEEHLAARLGVSKSEIRRRVSVAEALLVSHVTEDGQDVGPRFPGVADIFVAGDVSVQAASTMVKELGKAQKIAAATPGVDATQTQESMEAALVSANQAGGSPLVSNVAKNWLNRLNTKDVEATPELKNQFQGLHLLGRKYGLNHGEFYLDDEQWASVVAGTSFEANPRTKNADVQDAILNTSGTPVTESGAMDCDGNEVWAPVELKDTRTRAQKLADGLVRTIKRGLESNKLPWNGGMRPQVMVAIDLDTLQGRLASESTFLSHSAQLGPVDPGLIRQIACEAELLPVVLNGEGRVLDVGAPQRLFTQEQRKILYARDLGCTAPGCMVPADGCEAHHVHEWSRGGPTTIDNGALVCHYHHKLVHETGWRIDISDGVPYWIPPKSVDITQTPIRNPYFHFGHGSGNGKGNCHSQQPAGSGSRSDQPPAGPPTGDGSRPKNM